jgi:hypothetical protein
MVFSDAGGMELPWGLYLSRRDTTSQTLFTLDRKSRPHFSHFTDFTCHFQIKHGKRDGESMVSMGEGEGRAPLVPSWAGDMALVCRHFPLPPREAPPLKCYSPSNTHFPTFPHFRGHGKGRVGRSPCSAGVPTLRWLWGV